MVGILLLEVYESVAKSVISVGKQDQKGYQMHFMAVKKVQKSFWFSGLFKFTVVKTDAKFQTKFVKGILFVNKRYTKEVSFLSTMV